MEKPLADTDVQVRIYHNTRCSKSREAMCIIEEIGEKAEVVEYMKNPLTEEELAAIIKMLGIKPKELVRTNESIYKEKYAHRTLTPKQWIKAMIAHPELMERPIVVSNGKAMIGRPPSLILDWLKTEK